MFVGWIFAGSACAAVAIAVFGIDYRPMDVHGVLQPAVIHILPLLLPSFGMLAVAAILAATEGRRSGIAGDLLHASGGAFMITYLLQALGTGDALKVGAVSFFAAWVLMALSTIKFARSDSHGK